MKSPPFFTIMDALVVDKFPILWFHWVSTENSPFHNDVWSSHIVHVETEAKRHVNQFPKFALLPD